MIEVGQVYKHTKRGFLYKIVDVIAFQCSSHVDFDYKNIVVYSPVDDETKKWSRLEDEFLGDTELDGKKVKRFELVNE